MAWFKVDDKLYTHRKIRGLTGGALALWVRAGSYCADHLTDGVVCPSDVAWLGGTAEDVRELMAARLWDSHPEGYVFHDWDVYQPSSESRARQREEWRERQAAHRDRKKNDTSVLPVPSRPESRVSHAVTSTPPADPETVADVVSDIRSRLRGSSQ